MLGGFFILFPFYFILLFFPYSRAAVWSGWLKGKGRMGRERVGVLE